MYERTSTLINELGIKLPSVYVPISVLSGGQRQAVAVARAVLQEGKVILMDEPTAGLDPSGREEMLDLIRLTAHKFGSNLLISSHLLGDVERTADRVIVLEGGRVKGGEALRWNSEMKDIACTAIHTSVSRS